MKDFTSAYTQMNGCMMIPTGDFQKLFHGELVAALNEVLNNGIRIGMMIQKAASDETLLTRKEAAHALNVSLGTIDNMRKRGDLESVDYGDSVMFERAEIDRFIRTHRSLAVGIKQYH